MHVVMYMYYVCSVYTINIQINLNQEPLCTLDKTKQSTYSYINLTTKLL